MVLKEVAMVAGCQPTGPGETPRGGAHSDAERDPGGAQASMATGGQGAPLGAWKEAQDARSQPMGPGEASGGGA